MLENIVTYSQIRVFIFICLFLRSDSFSPNNFPQKAVAEAHIGKTLSKEKFNSTSYSCSSLTMELSSRYTLLDDNFLPVIKEAENWIERDPNPKTKEVIAKYLQDFKTSLEDKQADHSFTSELYINLKNAVGENRLEFGTAGLRAAMGPGIHRMNDLTVIQTTQGLVQVLDKKFDKEGKDRGVVIGYDHRENAKYNLSSRTFAYSAAAVFIERGYKVYLLEGRTTESSIIYACTPLVPFTITHFGCIAGIMITASHNPKIDNGYKLYWENGVQIIPPIDAEIANTIELDSSLIPWQHPYVTESKSIFESPNVQNPFEEICELYFAQLESLGGPPYSTSSNSMGNSVNIVYSAMHGVGHYFAHRSFQTFALPPFSSVSSQELPDSMFPTVNFPNPEEKGALNDSISFANEIGATLILANDPDADRLAMAELLEAVDNTEVEKSRKWYTFTGNEIGTLFGFYMWEKYKASEEYLNGKGKSPVVVASTVSSKMLRAIGEKEGFLFEETLTGFKWIGSKAKEMRDQGHSLLLAYEEAIGYCLGNIICDKDGVSAAGIAGEMANYYRNEYSRSLYQQLRFLHTQYGEFISNNHYFFCHEKDTILSIFSRLRNEGEYWKNVQGNSGKDYIISGIRDLTVGYDSSTPDKYPTLPVSPSTQMVTYTFANGCVLTLRTSGTEPKIKYYSEMQGKPGVPGIEVKNELQEMLDDVLPIMLEPEKNNLGLPSG